MYILVFLSSRLGQGSRRNRVMKFSLVLLARFGVVQAVVWRKVYMASRLVIIEKSLHQILTKLHI